jgi:hypothetical protein
MSRHGTVHGVLGTLPRHTCHKHAKDDPGLSKESRVTLRGQKQLIMVETGVTSHGMGSFIMRTRDDTDQNNEMHAAAKATATRQSIYESQQGHWDTYNVSYRSNGMIDWCLWEGGKKVGRRDLGRQHTYSLGECKRDVMCKAPSPQSVLARKWTAFYLG